MRSENGPESGATFEGIFYQDMLGYNEKENPTQKGDLVEQTALGYSNPSSLLHRCFILV